MDERVHARKVVSTQRPRQVDAVEGKGKDGVGDEPGVERAAVLGLDPDVSHEQRADARPDEDERHQASDREADDQPRGSW